MPTIKPRITITLSEEVHETLQGLSVLQGRSMSSIVAELLETVHPVHRKVLAALRQASSLDAGLRFELVDLVSKVDTELEQAAEPFNALLDRMACTCTVTEYERQEDALCPVHGTAAP